MNNVLALKNNNKDDDGLELVHQPMYKTSDGSVFEDHNRAKYHQKLVTSADRFAKSHRYDVYGHALRGNGYETIYPDAGVLEAYTRNLLQHVRDGKIKLY